MPSPSTVSLQLSRGNYHFPTTTLSTTTPTLLYSTQLSLLSFYFFYYINKGSCSFPPKQKHKEINSGATTFAESLLIGSSLAFISPYLDLLRSRSRVQRTLSSSLATYFMFISSFHIIRSAIRYQPYPDPLKVATWRRQHPTLPKLLVKSRQRGHK